MRLETGGNYAEEVPKTRDEIDALRAEMEALLQAQPAPFTAGYRFEVIGGNENLRQVDNWSIQAQTSIGDIFTVVNELPARGSWQYVQVRNANGEEFALCINDALQQSEIRSQATTVVQTQPEPVRVASLGSTSELIEGPEIPLTPTVGLSVMVENPDNLRPVDGGGLAAVQLSSGDIITFERALPDRGRYQFWEVSIPGQEGSFRLCINDSLTFSQVQNETITEATSVASPGDADLLTARGTDNDPVEALTEITEIREPIPTINKAQSDSLSLSRNRLTPNGQTAYDQLLEQVLAQDAATVRGMSPVHFESDTSALQLDTGNFAWSTDVDLSVENWSELTDAERHSVVEALNLFWTAHYGETIAAEPSVHFPQRIISQRYRDFVELADSASNQGSEQGELMEAKNQLINSLIGAAELNPTQQTVVLIAEYFQIIRETIGDEAARELSDRIRLSPILIRSPHYPLFCEVVDIELEVAQVDDLINQINFSALPIPQFSRPFGTMIVNQMPVVTYNNQPIDISFQSEWNSLRTIDQAAVITGLNNKLQLHYGRYDTLVEASGKNVLDLFGDYDVSETTQAVLARLREEGSFLNALPAYRQQEAACAAFMTRYLENIYGPDFSSFSGLGGRNAWEYASTLTASGYGLVEADLSDFYEIDPLRAQNERDKEAITINNSTPEFEAAVSSFVDAAFADEASTGIVTFHYRLTSANDDIVNTPNASPNSHVTSIIGPRDYEAPVRGRSVADSLMRQFASDLNIHQNGLPQYLSQLRNVQVGETQLQFDPALGDFVDATGQLFVPPSGGTITYTDVELVHFYHKHNEDTDPVRRDGLVSLMATGLFEPVQVVHINPRAATPPDLNQAFNQNFIISIATSPNELTLEEVQAFFESQYISEMPELSPAQQADFVQRSLNYVQTELYQSIFQGHSTANERVLPANSSLPIINWDQSPVA